jgi:hypothetical protein
VHKGVQHLLKPMPKNAITTEVFALLKKTNWIVELTPKLRTTLVQGGENDMRTIPTNAVRNSENSCKDPHVQFHPISNIAIQGLKCGESIIAAEKYGSKLRPALFEGGKDNIAMSVPTSSTGNSINPIPFLFGAFSIELKRGCQS